MYVSNGLFAGSQDISALTIAADGSLSPVAGSPFATGGATIEGLAITPDARHLYVAAFTSGDVRGYNVAPTGGLSPVVGSPFPTGSTPLGVSPAPDGTTLYAWNHGNSVGAWSIAATGSLTQVVGSPFGVSAGHTNPFGGSVSPDGRHLYVPNENTVPGGGTPDRLTVYEIAPGGALSIIQSIPTGNNPFGSAIAPSGKFLYVSNPEADPGFANGSISGYAVNPNGTLTELPGSKFAVAPGNHPLGMAITPDGEHLYVATRVTNTVNAYRINASGSLTPVPGSPFATGGTNGKALALTPDGNRLYVSNQGSNNVSGFNVAANGSLTLIGPPWPTGGTSPDLESIAITPNQPPAAAFTASPKAAGSPTTLDGGNSTDADGTVARYRWDFGDGSAQTQTDPVAQHTYTKAGTYTVALTVTDDEGCSTERIFTGRAMLCNGSSVATRLGSVAVAPAKGTPPSPQPTSPDGPGSPTSPARLCLGKAATLIGTAGRDRIRGTSGPDVILALGGKDRVAALGGNDRVCTGAGKDTASGGSGRDRMNGGRGADRLRGGPGRDRLAGGPGRDRLRGGPAFDSLRGGAGRDRAKQ